MIAATRVLDCVVEIVKAADRPLVAREICSELQRRGVSIEKANLNHILYKENDRRELVVNEQTFAWRYDRYAAKRAEDSEKRQEEIQRAIAKKAALLKIWKHRI